MKQLSLLQEEIHRIKQLPAYEHHEHQGPQRAKAHFDVWDKGYKSTRGEFFDDAPLLHFRKYTLDDESKVAWNYYPIRRVGTDSEEGLVYFVVLDQGKEIGYMTHKDIEILYNEFLREAATNQ